MGQNGLLLRLQGPSAHIDAPEGADRREAVSGMSHHREEPEYEVRVTESERSYLLELLRATNPNGESYRDQRIRIVLMSKLGPR